MPHLTASTSREAYRNLDASSQYEAIMQYLRSISPESSCIADIAHALHMERSTVSARLNEIKNGRTDYKIVYDGTKKSKRTGIASHHWKVPEQESLFT